MATLWKTLVIVCKHQKGKNSFALYLLKKRRNNFSFSFIETNIFGCFSFNETVHTTNSNNCMRLGRWADWRFLLSRVQIMKNENSFYFHFYYYLLQATSEKLWSLSFHSGFWVSTCNWISSCTIHSSLEEFYFPLFHFFFSYSDNCNMKFL